MQEFRKSTKLDNVLYDVRGPVVEEAAKMEEAMKEVKMVVEGVYSAKAAIKLAEKYNVSIPIIEQVNKVLFENKPADEAVRELMVRDKKIEYAVLPWEE